MKEGPILGPTCSVMRTDYTSFNRVLCLSTESLVTASFVISVSSPFGQAPPVHMYGLYRVTGTTLLYEI